MKVSSLQFDIMAQKNNKESAAEKENNPIESHETEAESKTAEQTENEAFEVIAATENADEQTKKQELDVAGA